MIETPQITQSLAQRTAFIPLVVPRSEIQTVMGPAIQEVYGAVIGQGLQPAGPWFTHHRCRPGENFDFKVSVPVDSAVTPTGRVQAGERTPRKVARTVYHGGYEGLGEAWGEFLDWIEAQGLQPAEDLWEVYLVGPESGPDDSTYRTELNRPLLD